MGHQGAYFQSSPLNFNAKCPSAPADCDFITLQRAEGSTSVDCPYSKAFPICFSCRGFSLAWVALLPATGWESLSCYFLGCTECWPCISGALCLKGGLNIYSLAGREGMQISLSSHRNPPAVRTATQVLILCMCSNLEWENIQDNLTHVQLCIFVPLCRYTDKIIPQSQKFLKPLH